MLFRSLMDMVYAGGGSGIYHCLNEEDVKRYMAHPQVMHASDGSTIEFGKAQPHPVVTAHTREFWVDM